MIDYDNYNTVQVEFSGQLSPAPQTAEQPDSFEKSG